MTLLSTNRPFLFLITGQFVSSVGNNFYTLAIYWYVLAVTHSRFDVLVIGMTQTLPAVGSLFWGGLIDRFDRRLLMIVSDGGRFGVAAFLFGVTHWVAHPSIWLLGAMVLLLKSLGTLFGPSASAFLPTMIADDQIAAATGLFKAATGVASLIGVSVGGILMAVYGPPTLFALDSLTFVVSVLSIVLIRAVGPVMASSKRVSLRSAWKTGLRVLWGALWIRRFVVVAMMANLVLVPLEMVLPQWVQGPLRGTPTTLGWLNTAFLVGFIGGAVTVAWTRRWPVARVMGLAFFGMGALVLTFGQVTGAPWPYGVAGGIGVTIGWVESLVTAALLEAIPDALRGRALSTYSGLLNLMTPVGMGMTELVVVRWGIPVLFGAAGTLVMILSFLFLIPADQPTAEVLIQLADKGHPSMISS
ncbi:MAG: hypothetical protein C7B46_19210 [Sulfobacillus benefaciens]|uniref:Major facilitator superfamily (MFS) profile domain-containing protein n=1 Tax=Sulfobacillus benefaciens TaxID=453960 RepID=A0A2T2X094_9FIRM|nr:MAG: hypothetical protein C7B46_19210 [Sulfobacillus benefaciens]